MWQDFAAGVLEAAMGSYANAANALQSGAGKAIAVSTTTRSRKSSRRSHVYRAGCRLQNLCSFRLHFLTGPVGMPREIVERLSGLMVEAGKTDKIQKLLDTYASTSPLKDTSRSRSCTTPKRPFGGCREGIGLASE